MTTDAYQGHNMANFYVETLKVKSVYVLDDSGAYGVGIANTFQAQAEKRGHSFFARCAGAGREVLFKSKGRGRRGFAVTAARSDCDRRRAPLNRDQREEDGRSHEPPIMNESTGALGVKALPRGKHLRLRANGVDAGDSLPSTTTVARLRAFLVLPGAHRRLRRAD